MRPLIKIFFFFMVMFPSIVRSQCDSLNNYLNGDNSNVIKIGRFIVEEKPKFPGGDIAREEFIKSNIKLPLNWPAETISGKVFLSFLVDEKGNIKYPCIINGLNSTLDSIAITIIKKMPKWIPAKNRGISIGVPVNLVIKFGIDNKAKQ